MKVHVSVQVFDHPSDAFTPFACNCGGLVRHQEAPEFTPDLDEYMMFSVCDSCADPYFVVGVDDANSIPHAHEVAKDFMKRHGSKFGR